MSHRTTSSSAAPSGGLFAGRNILFALATLFLCGCAFCAVLAVGAWAVTSGPFADLLAPTPDRSGVPAGRLSREQTKAAAAAVTFVQKVQNADWPAAYALCTPALQRQVGNAAALGRQITDAKSQPGSGLVVEAVSDIQTSDVRATVTGTARFGNTAAGPVRVELERVGADWKVNGFSLNLNN